MTDLLLVLSMVLATSALSGTLGMGGGLILMAGLVLILPIGDAFIWHGLIQLAANGSRAWVHRRHVRGEILHLYMWGTAVAVLVFSVFYVVAEPWIVFLFLGLSPFLRWIPGWKLSVETKLGQFLCGASVTAVQLLAGASGPLLDIFYLGTRYSREEVVATKAVTQTLGHVTKVAYYIAITGFSLVDKSMGGLMAAMLLAVVGTSLGKIILLNMTDTRFRRLTSAFTLFVGVVFLGKALFLLIPTAGW